jgi:hypothetical protein
LDFGLAFDFLLARGWHCLFFFVSFVEVQGVMVAEFLLAEWVFFLKLFFSPEFHHQVQRGSSLKG